MCSQSHEVIFQKIYSSHLVYVYKYCLYILLVASYGEKIFLCVYAICIGGKNKWEESYVHHITKSILSQTSCMFKYYPNTRPFPAPPLPPLNFSPAILLQFSKLLCYLLALRSRFFLPYQTIIIIVAHTERSFCRNCSNKMGVRWGGLIFLCGRWSVWVCGLLVLN